MQQIIRFIDRLNEWIGKRISWFTTFLVVLIFVDVFLRYLFKNTAIWVTELEWHFFAIVFLIGAAYALQKDQHVRVDLFYTKFSKKRKAWVNLIGTVLFLIPWCLMIIYASYKYAHNSLLWNESSADPAGLPARYIIKFAITLGFILLLLQAISLALRSILIIREKEQG